MKMCFANMAEWVGRITVTLDPPHLHDWSTVDSWFTY